MQDEFDTDISPEVGSSNTLTRVFDYVVPLNRSSDVATAIYEYLQGDISKLKWQINFSISPANLKIDKD